MSGTEAEVLTGGRGDGGPLRPGSHLGQRPAWLVPTMVGAVGVLVGVLGAHLFGGPQPTMAAPRASAAAAAGPGVVVPEVVDAQTIPGNGGMEVVAESVPGASTPGTLRYDYRLDGAVWLAPDGTTRSGPPGCVLAEGEPEQVQYLQVAVVHARAVQGGPNIDRVVWFRCAPSTGSS